MKTVAAAEKVVSEAFGNKVRLGSWERLGGNRSHVFRCRVIEGSNETPASVIVKQAIAQKGERYDPDLPEGPAWRLFNEWAGLRFLDKVSGGHSPTPRFYGGGRDTGIIVTEDLSSGKRLDQFLLESDPITAEKALIEFFKAIGKMHALSIGKKAQYDQIRNALGPLREYNHESHESIAERCERYVIAKYEAVKTVDVAPQPGFDEELEEVARKINHPGPFLAYIRSDCCPDNSLRTKSGMKLLDFEFGRYGQALVDGVFARIHFPGCWCVNRIPEEIITRVETAYRSELVKGCPEAKDDSQFYQAVVEACAFFVFEMLSMQMPGILGKDRKWHMATVRQCLLVRLDVLTKTTEEFGHLEAIGATARVIAEKLRAIWPPEVDEMPYYPAFR